MSDPTSLHLPDAADAAPFVAELAAYFDSPPDAGNVGRFDIGLNLLDKAASDRLTTELANVDFVRAYAGAVLDDGNTSDYHLYLTRGPFAGGVFFLSHDDDSYLAFASLSDFLAAVETAKEDDVELTDCHPSPPPLHRDASALGGFIDALLDSAEEGNDILVYSAIRSLAPVDKALLMRLAAHPDFLFAEAVAGQIEAYPTPALRPIAQLCSAHAMPQVQWAGDRAVEAIDQLAREGDA